MVEGCAELVKLFLCDSLAVPGEDLVLHLVDCPENRNVAIICRVWLGRVGSGEWGVWPRAKRGGWSGLVIYIVQLSSDSHAASPH